MTTVEIMEQAQVFASSWALVGSRFDSGFEIANAHEQKADLREMIEALAKDAAPAWMPIETAPKRDEIDIWSCGDRIAGCVFGKPTYGKTIGWIYESHHDCDGLVYELVSSPTHWMALPKPPAIEAAQAE